MAEPVLDAGARERIGTDLDSTLFVEAGAGSGKTTALVDRVLALVTTGTAELRSIAAITFTEKAGAELRDRLRRELERRADSPTCRVALEQLDGAAIGTLHSFAQTVLSENPIEAGLPPAVEVLDEVSSGVEFGRRWAVFRDRMLADPALERSIILLTATGVRHDALRVLAVAFGDNWDLVADRVPRDPSEPPSVAELLTGPLEDLARACDIATSCRSDDDLLLARIGEVREVVAALRSITDEVELVEALGAGHLPRVKGIGRKTNWDDVESVRADLAEAMARVDEVRAVVGQACITRVAAELRSFTLAAAAERRVAGRLEFHDLLVLARALVTDPVDGPAVRLRLHRRYQRILLDEFQDTDPIQIEIAVRIAARDPLAATSGSLPWGSVDVAPGHLFVVGDPKQSIYRFRRADIATFIAARRRFGSGACVELTSNFRTVEPVIDWINAVFGRLMVESADTLFPEPTQATYIPLSPVRPPPVSGPPVSVIGREPSAATTRADELRATEAADVVAAASRALAEGWTVGSESGSGSGSGSAARPGDITVLVPTRTSLPFLEDAFEAAGIPCRAESSSLVYSSRAVRDLLMVLRAADDPTDQLRIVAALRTPLLGCGDDDLFRYRIEAGGSWSYLGSGPSVGPVAAGLLYLRELHTHSRWLSPSELLTRIAVDRRAFELGFAEGRARDVWRRLRFVIDQARAWSDATAGSLRQYLQWVEQQTAEGARVAEAILPETDDDAVRIMTIHAAKGLEFPIVILSGMSTVPGGGFASAQVVFPPGGGVGYRLGKNVTTREYEDWKPVDEQMGLEERIRLLYVACTRARDHLVVSVRRKERPASSTAKRTNAELLVDGMGTLLEDLPDVGGMPSPVVLAPAALPEPIESFEVWEATRSRALTAARRLTTVAATALTSDGTPAGDDEPDDGLHKRPRDLDLPPWQKGRYGSAVGRAVHGVLQTIPLGPGVGVAEAVGVADAVAAQCEAEAIPDRAELVSRLVSHALESPCVREAAASSYWREVYVCTPVADGRLLEGYVDLLYRRADGLVVVDYKTAATSDLDELSRRLDAYRLQGSSYAMAVAAATGEPVVRVAFLFLTPDGAVELDLPDLDSGVAEVLALTLI